MTPSTSPAPAYSLDLPAITQLVGETVYELSEVHQFVTTPGECSIPLDQIAAFKARLATLDYVTERLRKALA